MTDPRTEPETGFASEDEAFDYISRRFFDTGGDIDAAIDWFFMGEHFSTNAKLPASLLGEDKHDGRLKTIVSSNFQKKYDLAEDPDAIEQLCRISPSSNERAEFTKNKKTVTVKGYKKTSRKITKPKGGKKYYVKIRTYKIVGGKKYYSQWSKAKTVRTKK